MYDRFCFFSLFLLLPSASNPIYRAVYRLVTTVFCSGGLLAVIFGLMSFNRIGPNLERSLGELHDFGQRPSRRLLPPMFWGSG